MDIRLLAVVLATSGVVLGGVVGTACVGTDPALTGADGPESGIANEASTADGSSPSTDDGSVVTTDAKSGADSEAGGEAGAWTPKSGLPGLALWLDSTVGVTFDGSAKLTSWLDQSGNGNNGTVSAPCVGPRLAASSLNGRDTLAFSETGGIGACVSVADVVSLQFGTGDFAMFMVARYTNIPDLLGAGDSTATFFAKVQVASPATGAHLFGNTSSDAKLQLWLSNQSGNQALGATGALNNNVFHRFGATRRGLDLEVWVDGASDGKVTLGGAADLSQVGRPLDIGGVPESSRSSLLGNIAEVVVIKGNATNAKLADLDAYFKAKHGL